MGGDVDYYHLYKLCVICQAKYKSFPSPPYQSFQSAYKKKYKRLKGAVWLDWPPESEKSKSLVSEFTISCSEHLSCSRTLSVHFKNGCVGIYLTIGTQIKSSNV